MGSPVAEPVEVEIGRTISRFDLDSYRTISNPGEPADDWAAGGLILGLLSAASSVWCERSGNVNSFSYGYDELRFQSELKANDTATVVYAPREWTHERQRLVSLTTVRRQDGATVATALHTLWFPPE